jgi:hypothetical protein
MSANAFQSTVREYALQPATIIFGLCSRAIARMAS